VVFIVAIKVKRNKEFTELLQRNLKARYEEGKRVDSIAHVSDIIPGEKIGILLS
jgi:hypothetical protein